MSLNVNAAPALNVKTPVAQKPAAVATPAISKPAADSLVLTAAKAAVTTAAPVAKAATPSFFDRVKAPFQSTPGKIFLGVGLALGLGISAACGVALGVTGLATWAIGLTAWTAFGGLVAGAALGVGGVGNGIVHAVMGK